MSTGFSFPDMACLAWASFNRPSGVHIFCVTFDQSWPVRSHSRRRASLLRLRCEIFAACCHREYKVRPLGALIESPLLRLGS